MPLHPVEQPHHSPGRNEDCGGGRQRNLPADGERYGRHQSGDHERGEGRRPCGGGRWRLRTDVPIPDPIPAALQYHHHGGGRTMQRGGGGRASPRNQLDLSGKPHQRPLPLARRAGDYRFGTVTGHFHDHGQHLRRGPAAKRHGSGRGPGRSQRHQVLCRPQRRGGRRDLWKQGTHPHAARLGRRPLRRHHRPVQCVAHSARPAHPQASPRRHRSACPSRAWLPEGSP